MGRRPVPTRRLRPFFPYYGSKWLAAPLYPAPRFRTVVEPFAGSASYSLLRPELDVVLNDLDPVVASVWRYLVSASERRVLSIPDVPPGGSVLDLGLSPPERALVGFWLNRCVSRPRRPSRWMREGRNPGSFWGERVRRRIASQLRFVRHWRVLSVGYALLPDLEATWFLDPPYEGRPGARYALGSSGIDYAALSAFARSRRGESVACGGPGCGWLPFRTLSDVRAMRGRGVERIWTSG